MPKAYVGLRTEANQPHDIPCSGDMQDLHVGAELDRLTGRLSHHHLTEPRTKELTSDNSITVHLNSVPLSNIHFNRKTGSIKERFGAAIPSRGPVTVNEDKSWLGRWATGWG